jgi:hypothetical protein
MKKGTGKLSGIRIIRLLFVLIAFMTPTALFAAMPLVTDDAGTVGKGKIQIELGGEASSHKDNEDGVTVKEKGIEASGTFTYGLADPLDLVLGIPYMWARVEEDGETMIKDNGIGDISLEVKWRFFEKEGFSFALKPGITFPTGNDNKGFGSGRMTYGLLFIATKELEPFAVHFNAGYVRNENDIDERKDIYKASLAAEWKVAKSLRVVADTGIERNADPASITNPAFALVGIIYSLTENIDLDAGFKQGLNKAEVDHSIRAGVTLRF